MQAAAAIGVLHDGRANFLQVSAQSCIWTLPHGGLEDGKLRPGVRDLGSGGKHSKGPWVAWRLLTLSDCGSHHGAEHKCELIDGAVRAGAAAAHDSVRKHVRFCASDGAADARNTGKLYEGINPACAFQVVDPGHYHALVGKWATAGDEEIELVEGLLVNDKINVAKFLTTSERFRSKFKDESIKDGLAPLEHFGWAPQRRSSKARPLRNFTVRLRQIFAALGIEADNGRTERRAFAHKVIVELGGVHSDRLLLAGFLADYRWELFDWITKADVTNGDVTTLGDDISVLLDRLKLFFDDGWVLTPQASKTFTGAVLAFLDERQILHHGSKAIAFEPPTAARKQAMLNRMRAVVERTREYIKHYRPEDSWQNRFRAVFRLPSPLLRSGHAGPAAEYTRAEHLLREICKRGGIDDWNAALQQLKLLAPAVAVRHRAGCDTLEAWGRASADFP